MKFQDLKNFVYLCLIGFVPMINQFNYLLKYITSLTILCPLKEFLHEKIKIFELRLGQFSD